MVQVVVVGTVAAPEQLGLTVQLLVGQGAVLADKDQLDPEVIEDL